jgi:hypothetical protein
MKRVALLCIALASVLVFASCSTPTKKAEKVTMEFFKALNDNNYDKARTYTGSEQAESYVGLMASLNSLDSTKMSQDEKPKATSKITNTEELQDTIICYVETTEPATEPGDSAQVFNQKVVLTKVENEWKIVEIPIK